MIFSFSRAYIFTSPLKGGPVPLRSTHAHDRWQSCACCCCRGAHGAAKQQAAAAAAVAVVENRSVCSPAGRQAHRRSQAETLCTVRPLSTLTASTCIPRSAEEGHQARPAHSLQCRLQDVAHLQQASITLHPSGRSSLYWQRSSKESRVVLPQSQRCDACDCAMVGPG